MSEWTQCFIGLGSNLGDSEKTLASAIDALTRQDEIKDLVVSSYYQSKPHGPQDQPDYINAVAGFKTRYLPDALLDQLQAIEAKYGRVREGERWTARTLDLDILLYGDQRIETTRLQVPHRWMMHREFVLYPLAEIAPDLLFPDGSSIKESLASVSDKDLIRLPTQA